MLVKRTMPDGRKLLISGPLSARALQELEQDHIEQIKPENAQRLLEGSGHATAVDEATILLPPPREDDLQ
jgi:hypothetical protein